MPQIKTNRGIIWLKKKIVKDFLKDKLCRRKHIHLCLPSSSSSSSSRLVRASCTQHSSYNVLAEKHAASEATYIFLLRGVNSILAAPQANGLVFVSNPIPKWWIRWRVEVCHGLCMCSTFSRRSLLILISRVIISGVAERSRGRMSFSKLVAPINGDKLLIIT